MEPWFFYLLGGCALAFTLGLMVPRKAKTTPSDVLTAYLEHELGLLVQKLETLKPHDMEGKNEVISLLHQKVEQARDLHNRLLSGCFETVHQKALQQVPFLTWAVEA